ncbi:glucans biosynthesis protein MdoC [Frankia sp. R82]|uniref:glucans biosynthesis protein MdoC n=1 Tax=Frankia sp. R82 TaxID=2950553 RepID=UPI00204340C4|nr:glucans biosynthesis protein MdoC [Frankia sp. R82]MCM3887014.1 glucans biosynthesis protein MdoC [Frankia sp. R82]
MREPKASSAPDVHYHHLDALRGAFMLVGVFVHVSTLGHDRVFRGIAYASGLFRMQGFYLISGFLSAMLVGKYGAGRTVRRRVAAVGAPLLSTLVLFNPPTLWMTYNYHNNPNVSFLGFLRGQTIAHPQGELHWTLHLWFLIVLLVYVLCTPAVVMILARVVPTSAFRQATAGRLRTMTTIVVAMLAFTIVLRGGRRAVVEPVLGTGTVGELARFTLEFLPFYCLGVLLYLDRSRLLAHFQRPAPVLLAVSGLALLASERGWVAQLASGTGQVLTNTVFSIALVATLFAFGARLVPGPRPAARYLADASYTVYLFHFFFIYVLATLFGFDTSLHWPTMLLLALLTIGVTLAVHHFLILRSAFLRKMFNGKFPATSGRRQDASRPVAGPASAAVVGGPVAGHPEDFLDPESTVPLAVGRGVPADAESTQQLSWVYQPRVVPGSPGQRGYL